MPLVDITLVMVTHDVALKNFADRVIWMCDGKILRVENVSANKRRKRMELLNTLVKVGGLI